MKKYILLALILALALTGCGPEDPAEPVEKPVDPPAEEIIPPVQPPVEGPMAGFAMLRYNWDGWGIGRKQIEPCTLGGAILEQLAALRETGETVPQISEDLVDEYAGELPAEPGTVWLDWGEEGLYRLNPEMTAIWSVERHLGEGKALAMTAQLQELLRQAWFYHPYDSWFGDYEGGPVTLRQAYRAPSAVASLAVEEFRIVNKIDSMDNRLVLRVKAAETKTVQAALESFQSDDNRGSWEVQEVELKAGRETELDFSFYGFYNHPYRVTVCIDNTRLTLTIDPTK